MFQSNPSVLFCLSYKWESGPACGLAVDAITATLDQLLTRTTTVRSESKNTIQDRKGWGDPTYISQTLANPNSFRRVVPQYSFPTRLARN